jgi:2-haloacid dehalogenase
MTVRLCVFDAYGTIFDVDAAARAVALTPEGAVLAPQWPRLSQMWRRKQLEYSWLRAVADTHADFWHVTQDALDWTLEWLQDPALHGLRATLLDLYLHLPAYPDAAPALGALRARGHMLAILSNGTPAMLEEACAASKLSRVFDALLSVEEVGRFKPAPEVYDLVGKRFGTHPSEVLFISANGWDAAAAAAHGFQTVWINRAGLPVDRLHGTPQTILPDLSALPDHCRRI